MSNHPVVHFEIPADDTARCQKFYEKMFGWQFEYWKDFDYYGVKTKNEKGEGIDGGMMKRKVPGQPFMNYVTVDDIDQTLQDVVKNGGMIALPKQLIGPNGEMGALGAFIDPEGNIIGLHQTPPKK